MKTKARGEGQGTGGNPQGDGGASECMCPECGETYPHEQGTPCSESTCPECGVPLEGIDEEPEDTTIEDNPTPEDDLPEESKVGRRVRTGKLSLIEKVEKELTEAVQSVRDLLAWAKYDDIEEPEESEKVDRKPLTKAINEDTEAEIRGLLEGQEDRADMIIDLLGKNEMDEDAIEEIVGMLEADANSAETVINLLGEETKAGRFVTIDDRVVFIGGPGQGGGGSGGRVATREDVERAATPEQRLSAARSAVTNMGLPESTARGRTAESVIWNGISMMVQGAGYTESEAEQVVKDEYYGWLAQEVTGDPAAYSARLEKAFSTKASYQVQPFHSDFGLEEDADWSFSADDGNAIIDEGGYTLYKQCHLVCDTSESDTPENKGAYTYPVAKLVDGTPTYFFSAAAAVNANLSGARTPVDLPASIKEEVASTVRSIYEAFDRDPEAVTTKTILRRQRKGDLERIQIQTSSGWKTLKEGPAPLDQEQIMESLKAGQYSFVERKVLNREDADGQSQAPSHTELEANIKAVLADNPDTAAFAFKAADGELWWLQFTSNAFQDREREIFTTEALEEYVKRHRSDDVKGEFWYRHIPGTKFADVTWQAMVGRFLVQAGPFDDTPVGNAFKAFFTAHQNGHPEIAPNGWGTSHGYYYDPKDRHDSVYDWLEIKESTVLPMDIASNPWSPMPTIIRSTKMNEKEKQDLMAIGGQSLVNLVEQAGEKRTKDLEEMGVSFKAVGVKSQLETLLEDTKDEALKARIQDVIDDLPEPEADEDEKSEDEPEPEPELTADSVADALKGVALTLDERFTARVQELQEANAQAIKAALEPIIDEIEGLKQTDSQRLDQKLAQTPAASLRERVTSVLEVPEAEVKETDDIADKKPKEAEAPDDNLFFGQWLQGGSQG